MTRETTSEASAERTMVCDCMGSMRPGAAGLDATTDGPLHTALCRTQLDRYERALASGEPITVACTQEAPLFAEIAADSGRPAPRFVNVRERAGWHDHDGDATPKVAALLAEGSLPPAAPRLLTVRSAGHVVVAGAGQAALDAALALAGRMPAVTLLLTGADDVLLPATLPFPVARAARLGLEGGIGGFTLRAEGFARLDPSSRREPRFLSPERDERIAADLVLDLTGGAPLVTGAHKRDGYERAEPDNDAAVARALLALTDLVGEFEKPIHVDHDPSICAHSRNGIVGCTNCLDACPAGAIAPAGDVVAIDTLVCAGCGSCASHCPSGSVSYANPPLDHATARMQALLGAYRSHGGGRAVLMVHGETHGGAMIDASARQGRGLPPEAIPLALPNATVAGHQHLLAAACAGAGRVVVLADPARADETDALRIEIEVANAVLEGLGHPTRAELLVEADPEAMEDALLGAVAACPAVEARPVPPSPAKREATRAAFGALGGATVEPFALPEGAPYGRIVVDPAACTLCMACVSACPAEAIRDNPERPELRFVEANCLQCGICARTCPEGAITLEARLDPRPAALAPALLNEEDPADCTRCGQPFAAASTVERMVEKLSDHWMYRGERAALLRMCEQCRLEEQAAGGRDPFAVGERPRPRTTEDYLGGGKPTVEDFLID